MATFFPTAGEFAKWLEKHGGRKAELIVGLEAMDETRFRKAKAAWKFFLEQPAGYQRLAIWRIVSAKRAETRGRRLTDLIQACRERRRL